VIENSPGGERAGERVREERNSSCADSNTNRDQVIRQLGDRSSLFGVTVPIKRKDPAVLFGDLTSVICKECVGDSKMVEKVEEELFCFPGLTVTQLADRACLAGRAGMTGPKRDSYEATRPHKLNNVK